VLACWLACATAAGNLTVAAEPTTTDQLGQTGRVDLTKIDRTLVKEPAYASKNPEYCLLVFGPRAETRIWLVVDGTTLYVDRNGNGDLTEPDEMLRPKDATSARPPIGDIVARDGKTVYRDLSVNRISNSYRIRWNAPDRGPQLAGFVDKLNFAPRAKDAPIVHLAGPLALTQFREDRVFAKTSSGNGRDRSLRVMLGTPGLGPGTFASFNCRACDKHGLMLGRFVFPAEDGGPPIEFTSPLEKIG